VFSTLHTNNAATCLPRLLDMGVEPFLIASTVRAVLGQRLVRQVCRECRVSYKPTDGELDEIKKMFNLASADDFAHLNALESEALAQGLGSQDGDLSTDNKQILMLWKANEGGCESCSGIGYRGRIGIYEVLENSTDVQYLIMNNGTSDVIQDKAVSAGMVTMQQDGFVKALRGQTTIEEILRVTRE